LPRTRWICPSVVGLADPIYGIHLPENSDLK
jgi:hypothetical protein